MPTHSAGSQQEGWGDGRWRGRAGSYRELTEYRSGLRGHGEEEAAAWPPLKEERRPGLPETAVRASRVPLPYVTVAVFVVSSVHPPHCTKLSPYKLLFGPFPVGHLAWLPSYLFLHPFSP